MITGVIQDFLAQTAMSVRHRGNEFHFIKSISVVLPTSYVAHNLREFVGILRRISIGSLYFHIFEARLRLQRYHRLLPLSTIPWGKGNWRSKLLGLTLITTPWRISGKSSFGFVRKSYECEDKRQRL